MGGDLSPRPAVEGALQAIRRYPDVEVALVGRERHLRRLLKALKADEPRLRIVDAPDVITMLDNPSESLRKRKSSLAIATALVQKGEADALVSPGNTGAVVAHCLLSWRCIPPVKKPAIATLLPSAHGRVVIVDSGAVVDCKPHQLLNFAAMGACYAKEILHIQNPRIGMLSIGEEDTKGNELSLAASALLRKTDLNFLGNAEGRDIFTGDFDVCVCDGFVGNIVLKTAEGTAKFVTENLRKEAVKSVLTMLGGLLIKPAVRAIKRRTDYDEMGGAPLLGVNGIAIIGHGSSGPKAFMNAIRVAREAVDCKLPDRVREWLERANLKMETPEIAPEESSKPAKTSAKSTEARRDSA